MRARIGISLFIIFALCSTSNAAIAILNEQILQRSSSAGAFQTFQISVPAGQTMLTVKTYSGSGDPSIYVKQGSSVSTTAYTYKSTNSGTTDSVTINSPAAGLWTIGLHAFTAFSSVNLVAQYTAITTLTDGQTVSSLSGPAGHKKYYKLTVPAGTNKLIVKTSGGTGNLDFYVKRDALPTLTSYTFRASLAGNTYTWTYLNPAAGTYYIMLYGAQSYTGASLNVNYSWTKTLVAAAQTMLRTTGQMVTALAFNDGSLELRDFSGKLISSRTGLGTITAINEYRDSASMLPRLYVACAVASGTLHVIDPTRLTTDLLTKTNLGTISFIQPAPDNLYIASAKDGGTLYKLNSTTLATTASKTGLGTFKCIGYIDGPSPSFYIAVNYLSQYHLRKINTSTLATVTSNSTLGTIYKVTAADIIIGDNGQQEVIVACSGSGTGTIYSFNSSTWARSTIKTGVGTISALAAGPIGIDQTYFGEGTSIAYASSTGTICLINSLYPGTVIDTRTGFGKVFNMSVRDYYLTDIGALGVISTDNDLAAVHIMDETLTDLTLGRAK
ncbi:MAG: hypothetical protein A2Y07_07635 [Planctomycetes bacterium GWF2_50_10]|nr:MAG: hypothetical protein A2Y07_07635 [Planctomycetes bacterium GWF2_50_10]